MELTLVDHLHEFDSHENSACIIELLEAEHRLYPEFDSPMVLLHYVVQVLTTANLHRVVPTIVELVAHAHPPQCCMAWLETIEGDRPRSP